jgi:hypothetical protein
MRQSTVLTTTPNAILPHLLSGEIPIGKAEKEAGCYA